jgi:predicted metal-dependent hydrolase
MVLRKVHELKLQPGNNRIPSTKRTRSVKKDTGLSEKYGSSPMLTARIGDRTIAYTLKRSNRARLVRLEIASQTGLTVVVPPWCSTSQIQRFLRDKSHWILDKLNQLSLVKQRKTNKLKNGGLIPYLGNIFRIDILDCNGENENITLSQNKLVVTLKPGLNGLTSLIEGWYRIQAKRILKEKVDRYSNIMVVDYNRIYLKDQKTLWGSCSEKGNLNFNWRLITTPEPVIDYVVIHELAHLKEMNHSRKFWQIVAGYCPEWQQHRKWLREHTAELGNFLRV